MGQTRDGRVKTTVRVMPARGGLATAGRQTTIPESAFWQMKDCTSALDGLVSKRPGLRPWGQTILTPDPDATGSTITSFSDFLTSTAGFVETDNTVNVGDITTTVFEGSLRTNVKEHADVTKTLLLSYAVGTLSVGSEWSLRFTAKGTNLPDYTPAATDPNTLVIRGQAALNTGKEFALHGDGLYYKQASDSTYVLVTGTALAGAGGWNTFEIRCEDVSLTGTSSFEFQWAPEGTAGSSTQYATILATSMYNDTVTDPFTAETVVALHSHQYTTPGGSIKRTLLCAAGGYVYHDNGLVNSWRPLKAKQHANVFFTGYRRTVVWSDHATGGKQASIWQWNGYKDPTLLDLAPPMKFLWEHQNRLFGAGDPDNPYRVYYSADKQPNVWFAPAPDNVIADFDTVINAGYVGIPGKKGDMVTAGMGDYYGISVVWTRTGVWRIDGHGPTSYGRQAINQDVGCETSNATAQVGNDVWFLSRQGVHTLSATDKFGNIEASFISAPIQNIWSQHPSSVLSISREYLENAKLAYNPHQGLVYVAVPLTGDKTAENIYVYNVNTQIWNGPWSITNHAMENVEVASPVIEIMMHGDDSGRIGYTDQTFKADFTTGSVDMLLESAYIDGRTISEILSGMKKTFKKLRLFIIPRGDWDFTVTWRVDAKPDQGPETCSQNVFPDDTFFIGADEDTDNGDFRLDLAPDGVLRSWEEMGVVEIPLDVRGYALAVQIEQQAAGQDLVIQGFEVEFTSDGYEQE
jgi:hypothetical protein